MTYTKRPGDGKIHALRSNMEVEASAVVNLAKSAGLPPKFLSVRRSICAISNAQLTPATDGGK